MGSQSARSELTYDSLHVLRALCRVGYASFPRACPSCKAHAKVDDAKGGTCHG
jgi:hypothetical protein